MASKTIHLCDVCEYYQEPFNDYPDRSMFECNVCNNWYCDECHIEHATEECFP
jgi:hypothetical protein